MFKLAHYRKYCRRYIFGGIGLISAVLLAMTLSIASFLTSYQQIDRISRLMHEHVYVKYVWHVLMMISVYFGCGIKIKQLCLKYSLSSDQLRRLGYARLMMIGSMILLDLIYWI